MEGRSELRLRQQPVPGWPVRLRQGRVHLRSPGRHGQAVVHGRRRRVAVSRTATTSRTARRMRWSWTATTSRARTRSSSDSPGGRRRCTPSPSGRAATTSSRYHDGYPDMLAQVTAPNVSDAQSKYLSFYAGDTITLNRATINLGLRFDSQVGSVLPSESAAVKGFENLLPKVVAPGVDSALTYNLLQPRVGVTYALDESRKTQLRATYAHVHVADRDGRGELHVGGPVPGTSTTTLSTPTGTSRPTRTRSTGRRSWTGAGSTSTTPAPPPSRTTRLETTACRRRTKSSSVSTGSCSRASA